MREEKEGHGVPACVLGQADYNSSTHGVELWRPFEEGLMLTVLKDHFSSYRESGQQQSCGDPQEAATACPSEKVLAQQESRAGVFRTQN